MTIKRKNGIAIIKSFLLFGLLFGMVLFYGIAIYMNSHIKTSIELNRLDAKIEDILNHKNKLLSENNKLQKRYDYIVNNSINIDALKEELNQLATALEENIVVPQTNSKILDINVNKISRLKDSNNKEYLNFVEVDLGIKSVHKYNTNEHAILRFKILSDIPSIKQVLKPYNINGVEYSFNEEGVTYKVFKKAQEYVE